MAAVVLERDDHVVHALLARILHAVAVGVEPHTVADGGRQRDDARIQVVVVVAGVQRDLAGLAGAGVGVGIERAVAALAGVGQHVIGRQRGGVELHAVGARLEVGEAVVAAGIGGRGGAGRIAAGVQQDDLDAGHAGFARVLHAVLVGIQPDAVAQRRALVEAGVDVVVGLAGGQRELVALAVGTGVAVGGGVAGVLAGGRVARRRRHRDRVLARIDGEAVLAVGAGGGGLDDVALLVFQIDLDADDARFARILHAIAVLVFPHAVAHGGLRHHDACVEVVVDGARTQRDLLRHTVGAGVGIGRAVAAGVGGGELVAVADGGLVELDAVSARLEVVEQVVAAVVGGRGRHCGAGGVQQRDLDAGAAGFVGVLHAVAVAVDPDGVAQFCQLDQAGVDAVVGLAGRQRDGGAGAGGVDVAVGGAIAAQALAGRGVAGRRGDGDRVGPRIDGEAVLAAVVGDGAVDHVAQAILQIDLDAVDAGFARILHAVGVAVFPHAVAERGLLHHQAGAQRQVVARGQRDLRGLAGAGVGVGTGAARAALRGGGEVVAGRQAGLIELHAVAAGRQAVELVVAVGVGGGDGAGNRVAAAVEQRDLDARRAGFAIVQAAVAVGVDPHDFAQRSRAVHAGVEVRVVLAGDQRDAGTVAIGADIAVQRAIAALARAGEDEARRRRHRYAVGAWVDGEAVLAAVMGGDGADHVAVGRLERDDHAVHALLARVLHAVAVLVFPHAVAQRGLHHDDAGVQVLAVVARIERDLAGFAGVDVGVRIGGAVAALAGAGEHIVRRQGGLVELHAVGARLQVVEAVVAVGVGGGGGAGRIAAGVQQHDLDAGHAGFTRVLHAVAVGVVPDLVAQRGRTVEAGVDVGVVLARGQRDRCGVAAGIDVAVDGIAAGALAGGHEAGRRGDGHRVRARIDGEAVLAAVMGGDAADHVAAGVLQVDLDAVQAQLAAVLHAVAVAVFPHAVAHGGLLDDDARIQVLVAVARSQRHLRSLAGGGVGVGILGSVAALVLRGEQVVGRQGGLVELYAVAARLQAAELVVAAGVGGDGGAGRMAGRVQQRDLDAGHAGFAVVLHAVAVAVVPDGVAQRSQAHQAGVGLVVGLARGQRDGGGVAAGIDVAVDGVAALALDGGRVAGRRLHGHRVSARVDVEVVFAAGVGGGGLDDVAVHILQLHGDVGQAGFARVLRAVAVRVFPDEIAQVRHRHLEGQVVRRDAGVGRAAADQAARVAHLEADVEAAGSRLAGHEAQVACGDVGGRDLGVDGHGGAVEHQLARVGQRGDDDGLEGVMLDRIDETEVALRQRDRRAVIQREHLVGAGRRVVDGIDHHQHAQRDAWTGVALLDDEFDGGELAVVVRLPVARVHIDGVRVDAAEQRGVHAGGGAVRQLHHHGADVQAYASGDAGRSQHVAHIKGRVGVFAHVDRGIDGNSTHFVTSADTPLYLNLIILMGLQKIVLEWITDRRGC
ncbi:hypothetical protein DUGA2_55280 [Duganella sp. HH101]|nr:hypothetical protein DUGA2_55280 [Duganella sp. HH101]